ncbi:MAG TPA: CorA family divalent cation transporter [Roseomonas sp.]|jgi:zinc transporter
MSDTTLSSPPCHGLIWARDLEATTSLEPLEVEAWQRGQAAGGPMWLHFDLLDARARAFLHALDGIPAAARDALTDWADTAHLEITDHAIWGTLPDFHGDSDAEPDPAHMGLLHMVLTPTLLVTARRHPLRAVMALRDAPRRGAAPTLVWDDVLRGMLDGFAHVGMELGARLDVIEEGLLRDRKGSRSELAKLRRSILLLNRRVQPVATIYDELADSAPPWLAAAGHDAAKVSRRVNMGLKLIEGLQDRGRIAQDELAAQAAEEANRQLLVLSVLTTVLLPPTFITGFFGMNTAGLPLTDTPGGFWWALGAILISAGLAFALVWRLRLLQNARRS